MSGLLKPKEAAEEMRISRATISRCKKMGAPVHYVGTCGKCYQIDPREFMEWMNSQGGENKREHERRLTVLELAAKRHELVG